MGNLASTSHNKYTSVDEPLTPVDTCKPCHRVSDGQQQFGSPNTNGNNSQSIIITEENFDGDETPVLIKSRHHIMALVDPRSPTQEISRTPISLEEQTSRREAAIARLAKLKENSNSTSKLTPNSNIPVSEFFDPRSPTQEIDRTPIRYANGQNKIPKRNL